MSAINTFCTEHLLAERLGAEHFADLNRMHQDRRVMRTLAPADHPNDGLLTEEETRRFIQRDVEHWEEYGYGLWIFRDQADGRFVGRGGLRNTQVEGNPEVEVAYALMADEWGKGLATDIARAVVGIGFEQLGLTQMVCFTLTTNRASQRVMEKAGFIYERSFVHAGLPHVLYRLRKEQRTKNKEQNEEPRTEN